mgnify:CR=1 FL=1
MPVNPGIEYQKAEREFSEATTVIEKLRVLRLMLAKVPKHKGTEHLQKEIKERIKKYTSLLEKEKQTKKGKSTGIKKEGAAQITIIGTTNSGKSTLLSKLTNAKPLIAPFPFTTTKPEIGTLDYKGIKLQIVEIPAIIENFIDTDKGLHYLSIIKTSDLVVLLFKDEKEKQMLLKELKTNDVKTKILIPTKENIKEEIWSKLNLIKVYTKQPGKNKDFPPVALKTNSTVRDLALKVHKDFIEKFNFARIWGKSIKHQGTKVSLEHILKDEDIVEFHTK